MVGGCTVGFRGRVLFLFCLLRVSAGDRRARVVGRCWARLERGGVEGELSR